MSTGLLLALFFSTGFAGLVYEVVWLRMLVRVFGSTSFATSNVLAVFMGGMALGAWLAGRWSKRARSTLAAYGAVEASLAAAAAAATVVLARLPLIYSSFGLTGAIDSPSVVVVRSILSAVVLLVPTMLMGASFPLLAERFAARAERGWDRPALLYGINTLGAVVGALATGYLLLGLWGETRTILLAAAVNAGVGVWALTAGRRETRRAAAPRAETRARRSELAPLIPALMGLSGFAALALEVLWTRLLILLLGNSVYAFSAMLAAYLLGLGLGSLACGRWLKSGKGRERAFVLLQLAAVAAIVATVELFRAYGLARLDAAYLYSPIRSASDFAALMLTSACVVLPVTVAYGALFPLALALADPRGSGEEAGRLYALNTLGAVLGCLACGFALIPVLGTRGSLYLLAGLHVAAAALAARRARLDLRAAGLAAAALALLAALRPDPFLDILTARLRARRPGAVAFHLEGASSTVTGYASVAGERLLLINGILVSGKGGLGRLMAHLPLLMREDPKRALVICLGAGNTFRAAVDHGVATDLSELEPEVVAAFPLLWSDAAAYQKNPAARMSVNDGRNFLLISSGGYDAIVVDGTPPIFSAGTVNLYSREFVELAARRLSPDGVLALWVPLPCFERDFWAIARNFTDVFPHALAWAMPRGGPAGILLMASRAPLDLDPKEVLRRAAARGLLQTNPWLTPRLLSPENLVSDAALRAGAAGSRGVTDDRPDTEFPLPAFAAGVPLREAPDFLPFEKR